MNELKRIAVAVVVLLLAALIGESAVSEWRLRRTYEAPDYLAGIEFVSRVAKAAEAANHHPDIDIRRRKVTLALVTHDAGGLTWRDTKLAAEADTLFAQVVKPG